MAKNTRDKKTGVDAEETSGGAGRATAKAPARKKTAKKAPAKKATAKKATVKKAAAKKATPKKAATTAGAKAEKGPAAKKKASKKAVVGKAAAGRKAAAGSASTITAAERHQLIAEAAYLRSEARAFLGDASEDWLAAEAEIDERLRKAKITLKG